MTRSVDSLNVTWSKVSRNWKILAIVGAFGLAGIWVAGSLQQQSAGVKDAETQVQPLVPKTVTALGRLEPRGTVLQLSVASSNNGARVDSLLVKEGQRVKAGQVLAVLDSHDRLEAALQEAQTQVRLAQVKLMQVRAGAKSGEIEAQAAKSQQTQIELQKDRASQRDEISRVQAQWEGDRLAQEATLSKLQVTLQNAQVEFERYRQLQGEGAVSASSLDSKRLTRDTAQQQVKEAQAVLDRINQTGQRQVQQAKINLQRTIASGTQQIEGAKATLDQVKEVRPVDVAVAQVEVDQAIAALQQAKANLDQSLIKAPQDGLVMKIYTHPGEVVSSAEGILDLGQTHQMDAVAEVYQSDISKVKIGQTVRISSSSLPAPLRGTVTETGWQVQRQNIVNTDPSANIDARVVEVRVALNRASSEKAAKFTNLQVQVAIDL